MSCTSYPAFGLQRRQVVGGLLAWGAVQVLPWAATPPQPTASATPAFLNLSRYLIERKDLSLSLAARLQAGLSGLDPQMGARVEALWQWVSGQAVALSELDSRLKAEQPDLAGLPRQLMQAWYMGIVGSDQQARVLAYEYALNAQLVSDRLRPPTYSYGVYGSWMSNPSGFKLSAVPVRA